MRFGLVFKYNSQKTKDIQFSRQCLKELLTYIHCSDVDMLLSDIW